MDFTEVLAKRRMVRNYTDEAVLPDALERIVDAGRRAPSAGFSQGQTFILITDPEIRSGVAHLAGEDEYAASGFDRWISLAPAHIVICVSEEAYHERYRESDKTDEEGAEIEWPVPFWWVDAGASMMAILLATVNEGLAAGFLGVHSIEGLKDLLGVPAEVSPIGIVTVGHAAPDRRSRSLTRGWKPDAVHRDRW
ncbi:MAG: nitroreductase family protein [Acidimicrobiia bacterium]|nr:nitroreductase family protein [Acidimicrobiia bacterium]